VFTSTPRSGAATDCGNQAGPAVCSTATAEVAAGVQTLPTWVPSNWEQFRVRSSPLDILRGFFLSKNPPKVMVCYEVIAGPATGKFYSVCIDSIKDDFSNLKSYTVPFRGKKTNKTNPPAGLVEIQALSNAAVSSVLPSEALSNAAVSSVLPSEASTDAATSSVVQSEVSSNAAASSLPPSESSSSDNGKRPREESEDGNSYDLPPESTWEPSLPASAWNNFEISTFLLDKPELAPKVVSLDEVTWVDRTNPNNFNRWLFVHMEHPDTMERIQVKLSEIAVKFVPKYKWLLDVANTLLPRSC